MKSEAIVVLSTCPDAATGERIARELVSGHLAACVNRLPGIRSTYRWEGTIRDEPEVLLIIKTTRGRYPELEMRLKALHPYDVPEIIALPVGSLLSGYLAWIEAETRASP